MSVPEDQVEDRGQLSPDAVAFLREAGSDPKGGFVPWPFQRARAPWIQEAVQQLTRDRLVEFSDADHARITPTGRIALVDSYQREADPETLQERTERSVRALYTEWHVVEDRARDHARHGREAASKSMRDLGRLLLRKAVRAEREAREAGLLVDREAEREMQR